MKKIFTLFLSVFFMTTVMAQAPTAVFKKASVAPQIDCVVDDVWKDALVYKIDKPFQAEVPTLGESGKTTWQALWDADGVYVLLKVTDDAFYPHYAVTPAGNNWEYDKPEIYFDVNYVLKDGVGAGGNAGHIQVAPGFTDGKNDGTAITQTDGVIYAFLVDGTNYIGEYFIPYTKLIDKAGIEVDKFNTIGFDVTIIDRDPGDAGRRRAVWANVGAIAESYSNMDDAGQVTFDGVDDLVYVDVINITGGEITTDNGTLQMVPVIEPADATNKKLKWTLINETGKATISSTGLVTAISDGTVTVSAAAIDGGWAESAPVTITISGQKIDQNDIWNSLNLIKNWNFTTDMTGWGGWVDTGGMVAPVAAPKVEEGVCVMVVGLANDGAQWHYQHNQNALKAEPNVPYLLKFKSWASGDAPAAVDFEDTSGNGYTRYGKSTDPEAVGGESEWKYNLTTEPTWFTFHVTFDRILDNTDQKVQWMLSLSNQTIYLDSVLLIKEDDYILSAKQLSNNNSLKVYPNPVGKGNILNVELASMNAKVAVYNAVGQKIMEKVSVGNIAKFDVSNLRKGMYFVRLEDGTTQKFIR